MSPTSRPSSKVILLVAIIYCLIFDFATTSTSALSPTAPTSAAIQTAINTAYTQLTSGAGQGVVDLIHPIYAITTEVVIKPGVTVRGVGVTRFNINVSASTLTTYANADPLTNGKLVFSLKLGSVLENVNIFVDSPYNGTIIGIHGEPGYWDPSTQNTKVNDVRMLHWGADPTDPQGVAIALVASPNGIIDDTAIQYARFQNIHIDRFRIGILLSAYQKPNGVFSWVNGNDFASVFMGECKTFIHFTSSPNGAETTGNAFRGLQIQPSESSQTVIHLDGFAHGNSFLSGTVWDVHMMGTNKPVKISSVARGNSFDVGLELINFQNFNTDGVVAKNRNDGVFIPFQP